MLAFGYSTFKNRQHKTLCNAFHEKFGFIPGGITLAQAGGIFLTFQKDIYFLCILIFSKNNFIVRDVKSEHYDFINSLPKEMTRWIKIKFSLLLVSVVFLLAESVLYYIFIKA
ncbi:hypothetical protein D8682_17700 [Buttiauxella sp. 3AFRM03]|nr:hypothetical protein D8682_17700 [Buttiauxella sp. 3AFRM03]